MCMCKCCFLALRKQQQRQGRFQVFAVESSGYGAESWSLHGRHNRFVCENKSSSARTEFRCCVFALIRFNSSCLQDGVLTGSGFRPPCNGFALDKGRMRDSNVCHSTTHSGRFPQVTEVPALTLAMSEVRSHIHFWSTSVQVFCLCFRQHNRYL